MKFKIPIFIILLNDTDVNIYKNKVFLKYIKIILEKYALYDNCVFLYSGDENTEYIKEYDIKNSYKVTTTSKIGHFNECLAIYEYMSQNNFEFDWFINMDPSQLFKNPNTIYESIRNIDSKYDFICFSNLQLNNSKYELNEKNKIVHNGFVYKDDIIKTVDTSLFITKTSWFKYCYKESNFNENDFGKIFWNGKYKILDMSDQLQINLVSIGQINNFINFLNNI